MKEITDARAENRTQFFQLYVNQDRNVTKNIIKMAEEYGCKALFVTVDAPCLGKREKDMRHKFTAEAPDMGKKVNGDNIEKNRNQGTAKSISSFIDPSLNWNDLEWIRSVTDLPIVLKGIQCAEDALLALHHGVQGIVISNHGGRQLDCARSAIEILAEVMDALNSVNGKDKMEVYIDGGIRRGSDIYKALALGAKAVGVGRPMIYGLAAFGVPGVQKVIQILKEELEMTMRLMGTTSIDQITPRSLILRNISDHFVPSPVDHLSNSVYIPIKKIQSKL
eukprot:TRINITY_DN596_c0_g3_i2.p1 TRINITY_DN596_c0_g3~~TRINITY_DN596_c0_g3_i2.p1  ORF type:complete len:279 (+),score=112.78 TRINITY_DN596_c0_g3_i2:125-961(+)